MSECDFLCVFVVGDWDIPHSVLDINIYFSVIDTIPPHVAAVTPYTQWIGTTRLFFLLLFSLVSMLPLL